MRGLAAGALLLLALPAPAPAAAQDAEDAAVAEQQDAIFDRVPGELPRAEPERWAELIDPETNLPRREGIDPVVIQRMQRAELAYRNDFYGPALEELYAILEAAPDFPPALIVLGTTYFRLRRYGDAQVAFERFVEALPEQVWRTQALGHCYYSLGDYERARDHYRVVLETVADSPQAIFGLALSHLRLGEVDEGLALLDRVVEVDPGHWDALCWKAQVLYDEDEVEDALVAAEAARELAPHEPRPWFLLMQVHTALGESDEAERAERRWRELDALTQQVRSVRAKLLYDPRDDGLAYRLVELTQQTGDVAGLREALDLLVAARPDDVRKVDLYVFALDTLVDADDEEGAALAAEALARDCPDDVETWRRLELYYALRRDTENQVRAGERRIRLEQQGAGSSPR